jgi:hypothetical protein
MTVQDGKLVSIEYTLRLDDLRAAGLRQHGQRQTRPAQRPRQASRAADADSVGNGTRFVVSELSGRSTLALKAKELGIDLGSEAPPLEQIQGWLDDWERERLVFREGARYLSLAVSTAERVDLPVDRFIAQLSEA